MVANSKYKRQRRLRRMELYGENIVPFLHLEWNGLRGKHSSIYRLYIDDLINIKIVCKFQRTIHYDVIVVYVLYTNITVTVQKAYLKF